MGDFIINILKWALEFWDFILGTVTGVLTTDPQTLFGGSAWSVIVSINTAFQSVPKAALGV